MKELLTKLTPLVKKFEKEEVEEKDPRFHRLHVEKFVSKELGVGVFYRTLEQVVLEDLILNNGKIRNDQYDLFPLSFKRFAPIKLILQSFSGKRGSFKLALGTYSRPGKEISSKYDGFIGEDYNWCSVASFPTSFFKLFKFKFFGNRLEIINQEELESFGILTFPRIKDSSHNAICVYLNGPISELEQQCENKPEALGWINSGSEHLGSFVSEPFNFEKVPLQKLGYMADDVFDKMPYEVDNPLAKENYIEWFYSKKYLEEYFERYKLIGKRIIHAQGNFPGRSGCNSYNKGLQNKKETVLNSAACLSELGYKGCRILEIKGGEIVLVKSCLMGLLK